MKTSLTFIILALLLCLESTMSQDFSFGYDLAGNRVSRTIVLGGQAMTSYSSKDSAINQIFDEKVGETIITIFPNPTRDDVFIDIENLDENNPSSIMIYDNSGRVIKSLVKLSPRNTIGLSDFPEGVYYIKVNLNGKYSDWKVIKE